MHANSLIQYYLFAFNALTPHQIKLGTPPNLLCLRSFGCQVMVPLTPPKRTNMGRQCQLGIYVGFNLPLIIHYLDPTTRPTCLGPGSLTIILMKMYSLPLVYQTLMHYQPWSGCHLWFFGKTSKPLKGIGKSNASYTLTTSSKNSHIHLLMHQRLHACMCWLQMCHHV